MKNSLSVVWDWNGTIVNDAFVFIKIMNDFLLEKNLPLITLKDYRESFVFPVKEYYKKLGFNFSDQSFKELSYVFIDKYKEEMFSPSLVKDVKKLLEYLHKKNVAQYIVSAQEDTLLKKAVDFYGLKKYFCEIRGIDNYEANNKIKIAKELFYSSLSKNKNVVLIGDTEHDAEVAKKLNIDCFLVSYGHCTKEKLMKTGFSVFDSIEDLKNALRQAY